MHGANEIATEFALAMRHKSSKEAATATLYHDGSQGDREKKAGSAKALGSADGTARAGEQVGGERSTRILLVDDNKIKRIVARKK